jgi:DNA-binding NarL/FixJ family response regulator
MLMSAQGETVEPMAAERAQILTTREREIVALIARGHSNQQIASMLAISEQTVKNKLTVIFGKLNLRGRVRLAVFAVENRIE